MDVLIFDLATLRYQWDATRATLSVLSSRNELLAVVDVAPTTNEREAAFQACDAALDRSRVSRTTPAGRLRHRIALYNPYSAEVSFAAVPKTKVFSAATRLTIPANGLPATLVSSVDGPDVLIAGDDVLIHQQPSFAALTRAFAAHPG